MHFAAICSLYSIQVLFKLLLRFACCRRRTSGISMFMWLHFQEIALDSGNDVRTSSRSLMLTQVQGSVQCCCWMRIQQALKTLSVYRSVRTCVQLSCRLRFDIIAS